MRFSLFILVIFISVVAAFGQTDTLKRKSDSLKHKTDTLPDKFYLLQKVKRDGVTMPEIEIKEVTVMAPPGEESRADFRRYERLVFNVKKVYPYALMVRARLSRVDTTLKNLKTEKERREYIKSVEKDVFAEFEDDIQNMTITQGRLLIKLIDRETSNTSYALIREYRGRLTAAFWQGIARIFGTNLKDEYDAFGDDALIELIIREVDEGRL